MSHQLYVGSISRPSVFFPEAQGEGISVLNWDEAATTFRRRAVVSGYDNPSWLAIDSRGRRLYATSEVADWPHGLVVAYELVGPEALPSFAGLASTCGSAPCHIAISDDDRLIAVSNYGTANPQSGSNVGFSIHLADTLEPLHAVSVQPHQPSSHPRQDRSHAHFARFAGHSVVGVDLGEDCIVGFDLETATQRHLARMPSGSGPRHLISNDERALTYVVLELEGAVAMLRGVQMIQHLYLGGQPSGLRFGPVHNRIYIALRGIDQIAVVDLDADGAMQPPRYFDCHGRTPRDLVVSPSGRMLIVANQDSNALVAMPIGADGGLGPVAASITVGSPTCIVFLPTRVAA